MSTCQVGSLGHLRPSRTVVLAPRGVPEVECEVVRLFDKLREPALRYIVSFGLSIHDGEEVAQEAFLALLQHLHMGKPRDNLRGWIFRVAHNLALKKRQANEKSVQVTESYGISLNDQLDPAWNPEELLWANERQERLFSVFCALPEKDQRCLRLRAEGLRYREIAEVLEMSLGAVSNSLARSLARMVSLDGAQPCIQLFSRLR